MAKIFRYITRRQKCYVGISLIFIIFQVCLVSQCLYRRKAAA